MCSATTYWNTCSEQCAGGPAISRESGRPLVTSTAELARISLRALPHPDRRPRDERACVRWLSLRSDRPASRAFRRETPSPAPSRFSSRIVARLPGCTSLIPCETQIGPNGLRAKPFTLRLGQSRVSFYRACALSSLSRNATLARKHASCSSPEDVRLTPTVCTLEGVPEPSFHHPPVWYPDRGSRSRLELFALPLRGPEKSRIPVDGTPQRARSSLNTPLPDGIHQ